MSAFVVEDSCINGPLVFLMRGNDYGWIRRMLKEETGHDISTLVGCEALANAMFALNVESIEQRYGIGEASQFRNLNFWFHDQDQSPNAIQAMKSLNCWHYQCAEGNIPETSELYKTMDRVIGALAQKIVNGLPAYERATWGGIEGTKPTKPVLVRVPPVIFTTATPAPKSTPKKDTGMGEMDAPF